MKRRKKNNGAAQMNMKSMAGSGAQDNQLYDLSTPGWDRYYQAMRKGIRFPRYYKKALNW